MESCRTRVRDVKPDYILLRSSAPAAAMVHADFIRKEDLGRMNYRGRVDRLFIIVQNTLVDDGKASLMLSSFKDYPEAQ
jgi:hypothetical protein